MKKYFIILTFILFPFFSVFAEEISFIGASLEIGYVKDKPFKELTLPIRPSLYLGLNTFSPKSDIGLHIDANFITLDFNKKDDDEVQKDDDLFGLSLSFLIGPVLRLSDCLYYTPGISFGFDIFFPKDGSLRQSYLGIGNNIMFVISDEFAFGFTLNYYPFQHYYESAKLKSNKNETKIKEGNDKLFRYGIMISFVF